ncbi:MAG: TM0106 family RecB-like putative nuclease [Deltaproteobacteria bacterium]|nr:TM0106 family RecB-like putative nuclease [Deltaproteobacteria bacterium]
MATSLLRFTPTALSGFFECHRKTWLDMSVARGERDMPGQSEIERRLLEIRGAAHEAFVLEQFKTRKLNVIEIGRAAPTTEGRKQQALETLAAMSSGADVIYQGLIEVDNWVGYPDFLLKTQGHSHFGNYSYEVLDAKLAKATKAQAIIQLCVYTEHLGNVQGALPEYFWIAPGGLEPSPVRYRFADYAAYYRRARAAFEAFVQRDDQDEPYPEPVEHCDVCKWWSSCEKRRRDDDHLSLVANITRRQRERFIDHGVTKLATLGALDATVKVRGIEPAPLARAREQARIQAQGRQEGGVIYELLTNADPGSGLERLPKPTPGDVFLDLEGDAFAFGHGLNYLFGIVQLGDPPTDFVERTHAHPPRYVKYWATNPQEEKAAFEAVIKRIKQWRDDFPDMHVFHFGHREADALKTLACRYATCEKQVDELLRDQVLVDLHAVTKKAIRASVEGYTLKQLEVLFGFERKTPKRLAAEAMQLFGWWLEVRAEEPKLDEFRATIERYNEDDCMATWHLRNWLEARRPELSALLNRDLARPSFEKRPATEAAKERQAAVAHLEQSLRAGVSTDAPLGSARSAKRLLADLLSWHWREQKSAHWEHYSAKDVQPSDRAENRLVLSGLSYEGVVGEIKQSLIHRYRFPSDQDHVIRRYPGAIDPDTNKSANVVAIGPDFVDISRWKKLIEPHPTALIPGKPKYNEDREGRLRSLADSIIRFGLDEAKPFPASRALLLGLPPDVGQEPGAPLLPEDADTVDGITDLMLRLKQGVLAVQGPPGSGKTYRAARAIKALLTGRKVGVTANSHSVVKKLLQEVVVECRKDGVQVGAHHLEKDEKGESEDFFVIAKDYPGVEKGLAGGTINLVGGTSFAWSRPSFENIVDVLVVDEAGQMSLANALAVAAAAPALLLVGDPAQLDQPQKGVHPNGADVSALEHWLGDAATMPADRGVLLRETRRLHPEITRFTSEVFYEGKLTSMPALLQRRIDGAGMFQGAGLRVALVEHRGNTSRADEEVAAIKVMIEGLLASGATQVDDMGVQGNVRAKDLMVIAPYNSQVAALKEALPDGVAIGTVDKFQGQEAAIVFYSMTTSSGQEAPRGLEFLFSMNRLNVATSRAKTLVVVVASAALLYVRCRTPRQMKLVNALCRYAEMAGEIYAPSPPS